VSAVGSVGSVAIIAMLVAFLACLVLCAFVIVRTKDTAGLRDVAVVIRAFGAIFTRRNL
jgi:hypothetical protein